MGDCQKLKRMSHAEIAAETRRKHPAWADVYIEAGTLGKIYLSMDIFGVFATLDIGWRKDLERADCPILLVTADPALGAIVLPETTEWIKEKHVNVEILHTPNVGHNIHREAEETTREAMFTFIEEQFL